MAWERRGHEAGPEPGGKTNSKPRRLEGEERPWGVAMRWS